MPGRMAEASCQRTHKGLQHEAEKPSYTLSVTSGKTHMHLTASLPTRIRRDRHEGRSRTSTAVHQTLARAKRSGGPEDRALYSCHCGYAFKAEVSTSVGCPHCGTSQAW